MKTHIIDCSVVNYPVGINMTSALNFVKEVSKFLKENVNFTYHDVNLLCTGSSGSILASLLFAELQQPNVYVCHFKKEGENSHSGNYFRMNTLHDINVIIDDFSSTGETIERIYMKAFETNSDIKINYLILSDIGTASIPVIKNLIQPENLVSSFRAIDRF